MSKAKKVPPAERVGGTGLLPVLSQDRKQQIHVPVTILSHRYVFGRDVFQVQPVGGRGEMSVNSDRLVWE